MLVAGRSNPRALHGRHQAGPARGGRARVQHAHPNARRLELHRSRRHSWRHRTPWRQCRNSAPGGQALSGSKAVGRNHSATGGHAEESLQTPRAGRWRESGLADTKLSERRSWPGLPFASVWRHAEARESVGPPASRAPSDCFPKAHRPNDSGASRRENADVRPAMQTRRWSAQRPQPPARINASACRLFRSSPAGWSS